MQGASFTGICLGDKILGGNCPERDFIGSNCPGASSAGRNYSGAIVGGEGGGGIRGVIVLGEFYWVAIVWVVVDQGELLRSNCLRGKSPGKFS